MKLIIASNNAHKIYEIKKILSLIGGEAESIPVYRGSTLPLRDEYTPVESEAAQKIVEMSQNYSEEKPLYIVAIGAITNVASAILLDPSIINRIVVVWLGANAHHYPNNSEFNLNGDVAAARAVMKSKVPFVSLPCVGVVSAFTTSEPELRHWLSGKSTLCDYLVENTVSAAEKYAKGRPWTRVIWDVCAVGWLVGGERFMRSDLRNIRLPDYHHGYEAERPNLSMRYVYEIKRDVLMEDLFHKLSLE